MSGTSRRSSRNSITCPTISNIFNPNLCHGITQPFLPSLIADLVSTQPKISCEQILALPKFVNYENPLDALKNMKKAADWQETNVSGRFPIPQQFPEKLEQQIPNNSHRKMSIEHNMIPSSPLFNFSHAPKMENTLREINCVIEQYELVERYLERDSCPLFDLECDFPQTPLFFSFKPDIGNYPTGFDL